MLFVSNFQGVGKFEYMREKNKYDSLNFIRILTLKQFNCDYYFH